MRRYLSSPSGVYTFGDDTAVAPATAPAETSLRDRLNSEPVSTVAAAALAYHGYRRTGSIAWALVYALAGKWFPIEAVPIALGQGFGTKKECK